MGNCQTQMELVHTQPRAIFKRKLCNLLPRARAGVSWRRRAKFRARAAAAETQRARAITQTYPPPPFAFPLQVPCVILGILDC